MRSGTRRASGRCRRRNRDKETRRQGDKENDSEYASVTLPSCLLVSPSPCLLVWSGVEGQSMAHLVQVGAGSGGMPVLDMLCRDPRITQVTLIEPDIYKLHNVERHLFPLDGVGRPKAELAAQWLKARRPELEVRLLECDLLDPASQDQIEEA